MKHITRLTAALVFSIALAGFSLSYNALFHYASDNGVTSILAWLWPLVIDGFMIVISLSILRASLYQEPTRYLWFLAILATVVSIGFNIAHAPATIAGRAVATVAPVAMFAAFEVFIGQVRRNRERAGMQESYKGLQGTVNDMQGQCKELQDEIENLKEKQDAHARAMQEQTDIEIEIQRQRRVIIQSTMDEINKANKELARLNKEVASALQDDTRSKLIMYYKVNPYASQNDAAQFSGVSRARVGQYLEQFKAAGIISTPTAVSNGAGRADGKEL